MPCINEDKYDVIILNFANCDMVGHTGVMAAAMKAVKTVDECVGRIVDAIVAKGGKCIITADHGNADQMIDPIHGGAFTAHTTNPVPVIVIDPNKPKQPLRETGKPVSYTHLHGRRFQYSNKWVGRHTVSLAALT